MSALAEVQDRIAELEDFTKKFADAETKLAQARKDALALEAIERKAAAAAKKVLTEALATHAIALEEGIEAVKHFKEKRQAFDHAKAACLAAERVAKQHDVLFATSGASEQKWAMSYEWRTLFDEVRLLISNRIL